MNDLKISLVQSSIFWEDKNRNLEYYGNLLKTLSGKSDLAVLPEMFSTGFSMHSRHLAETDAGRTIQTVHSWAQAYHFAVCGSYLAKDDDSENIFNRGFFITPEGDAYFYDKRHLFRMGEENEQFTAGNRIAIIPYKGWNIRLIICYDLRFPVWTRNRKNEYDLLVCPANWPAARANVWETLLKARALENQCYVGGVNRIGEDGIAVSYKGDSVLIDFKGKAMCEVGQNTESVCTEVIRMDTLNDFREKFPVWKDADDFEFI
jgi:predicted amidohydrolase